MMYVQSSINDETLVDQIKHRQYDKNHQGSNSGQNHDPFGIQLGKPFFSHE
jgi:hypothetical protein